MPVKYLLSLIVGFLVIFSLFSCTYIKSLLPGTQNLPDNTWVLLGEPEQLNRPTPQWGPAVVPGFIDQNKRQEFNKTITSMLDNKPFPRDHLLFLTAETISTPQSPNPVLSFAFATPQFEIPPHDIVYVYFNGKDVSDQIQYGKDSIYVGHVDVFQGMHYVKEYLAPDKQHTYEIALKFKHGPIHKRTIKFTPADTGGPGYTVVGFDDESESGKTYQIEDKTLICLGETIDVHRPKIDPYMPEKGVWGGMGTDDSQRIESMIDTILGESRLPGNGLLFLYAEPYGTTDRNPPHLDFAFVAPTGGVSVNLVKVYLDGKDISDQIQYGKLPTGDQRMLDKFHGSYFMGDYLDPAKEHSFEITFSPADGNKYIRKTSFSVREVEIVNITMAGFSIDDETGKTRMDKIVVWLNFPSKDSGMGMLPGMSGWDEEHLPPDAKRAKKMSERLLNPNSWILRYEDGSEVPKIISIDGQAGMFYTLTLEKELVEQGKTLSIQVKAAEGMISDPCKLQV